MVNSGLQLTRWKKKRSEYSVSMFVWILLTKESCFQAKSGAETQGWMMRLGNFYQSQIC